MTRAKGGHPTKKKHPRRPREVPVLPLSEGERRERAQLEYRKANLHLAEAEALVEMAAAPNACAHAAYYAMHHGACAALLLAGGVGKRKDVPKSHEHVLEHFTSLVLNETGPLARTGLMLNRARGERVIADYDLGADIAIVEAAAVTKDARVFLEACRARGSTDNEQGSGK